MMSEIKHAFLSIKLKTDEDENKFSIFWIDPSGNLVAYCYRTIVFGFISSPFILNHLIKFHVSKYEEDECSYLLQNNLYVDNFFVTGNDLEKLQSYSLMAEGGFILRSWNLNSLELRDQFLTDENFVTHDDSNEKLLGYTYSPLNDTLSINVSKNTSCSGFLTKRKVLSDLAGVFDPLGLGSPVIASDKKCMRKLRMGNLTGMIGFHLTFW